MWGVKERFIKFPGRDELILTVLQVQHSHHCLNYSSWTFHFTVLINHRFVRGSHFLVEYIHLQVYACKASAVERYLTSKSFRTCLIFTKHSLVYGQDPTGIIAQKYYVQRGEKPTCIRIPVFIFTRNWLNPRIGQTY